MPKVTAPFFSGWASGSIGKSLTCRWYGNNNTFFMQKYKSRSGKRHQIQIDNAKIFGDRAVAMGKALRTL